MTFFELKALVSYWLDDLQFGYFTEPQVERFLNNAQKEAQKLLVLAGENYYVGCPVETQTVVGQSDYVLPNDFLKVNRLEIVESGNDTRVIAPITLNQQDFLPKDNAASEAYYLRKGRLILVPPPDSIKTLRLWYSYRVADMVADTEIPDVPEEYHEFLAVLAAYDGLLKDGRPVEAMLEKRRYYEDMMKRAANERTVDRPRRVVITDMGYGSAY